VTNYPLQLAVGEIKTINSVGTFIYYESASAGGADTSILVTFDTNDQIVLKVGQGQNIPRGFNVLRVKNNLGQGAIIGNLVIADSGFVDNRNVGTVEVIDGGKNRSNAGIAFCAPGAAGASAGQYTIIELWNPAGSGKNAIIEQLTLSAAAATISIFAGWTSTNLIGGPVSNITSKKAGSANATSYVGIAFAASATPASSGTLLSLNLQGNTTITYSLREPIIIPPGYGFWIGNTVVNTGFNEITEFIEDAI
jgi:hypothetical protein